jgi:hypothetical protein
MATSSAPNLRGEIGFRRTQLQSSNVPGVIDEILEHWNQAA